MSGLDFLNADKINYTPVSVADPLPVTLASGGGTGNNAGQVNVAGQKLLNAAGTTLTRPANTTAYTANDSISDNATAASVTAIPVTISDAVDAPVLLTEIILDTTDTGLAASVQVRAYLFNSDPTANTGVQGGDNAAYSQKQAGFVGSFSGTFRPFFAGGKARLVPDEGSYLIANVESSGQRLWIQYQALGSFTPSASSTTIACRLKGFQGRA